MKTKHRPKFVVLTSHDIAIGEFKSKRELNNFLDSYKCIQRPVVRILSGTEINAFVYLPLF